VEILVGESVYFIFGVRTAFHTSFLTIHPLPASNNFWTKVQLSTKSDAFLSTIILLSLIIFFQPTARYF